MLAPCLPFTVQDPVSVRSAAISQVVAKQLMNEAVLVEHE